MATLLSVNVGLPRNFEWRGQHYRSAIWKEPVDGRRMVRRLNIDGDAQADLRGHGGEQRAVLVYQLESYKYWSSRFGWPGFEYGQFGENLTVEGLPDEQVCIGDQYKIGDALFEVTQPRVTCYRLGIRLNHPELPGLLVSHGRPGFYMRVIREGEIGAGDEIIKTVDGPHRMSVARTDALLYSPVHPAADLKRILKIPALSPGWRGSFEALLQQAKKPGNAGNPGLAAPMQPPLWQGFRSVRIDAVVQETDSVRSYLLCASDGGRLPAATAGQYLVVRRKSGRGAGPVIRSYSISGAADCGKYRISVKREGPGSASADLHESINEGDVLEISAPRGNFVLQRSDRPVVLISAGIGATPLVAMLHALAATSNANHATRETWWIHGARDRNTHVFAAETQALLSSLAASHRHIAYSQPAAGDAVGPTFDSIGRIDDQLLTNLGIPDHADVYVCGPSSFMEQVSRNLERRQFPPENIHTEAFGTSRSGGRSQPTKAALTTENDTTRPLVNFTRSGISVRWAKDQRSLLEFAEALGVETSWSCRSGVCHQCEASLIEGNVSYEVPPLDMPVEGRVLICCAKPTSDLQLDL